MPGKGYKNRSALNNFFLESIVAAAGGLGTSSGRGISLEAFEFVLPEVHPVCGMKALGGIMALWFLAWLFCSSSDNM